MYIMKITTESKVGVLKNTYFLIVENYFYSGDFFDNNY